jgi:hypothetical protein
LSDALVGGIANLASTLTASEIESRNRSFGDLGEGGEEARRLRRFLPRGLTHGELLERIYLGDKEAASGNPIVHLALQSYVVKFSAMCQSALPAERVEITTVTTNSVVTTNLLGITVDRYESDPHVSRTGIFTTREMGELYVALSVDDVMNRVGATMPFGTSTISVGRHVRDLKTQLEADMRRTFARHGCTGAVTEQLASGLRDAARAYQAGAR